MNKNGIKYKPDNLAELTQSKEFFINLNALTEPNLNLAKRQNLEVIPLNAHNLSLFPSSFNRH